MNLQEALLLVREKFLEEKNGQTNGPKAGEYRTACEDYPAMMTTAHHLWAREMSKNPP